MSGFFGTRLIILSMVGVFQTKCSMRIHRFIRGSIPYHRRKQSFIRDRVIGFVIYIIISEQQTPEPEMEFLDINLTKESRSLLHAIHSTFYWWILKKTRLFSDVKNPYKKPA
jgi:hypothetical protein